MGIMATYINWTYFSYVMAVVGGQGEIRSAMQNKRIYKSTP